MKSLQHSFVELIKFGHARAQIKLKKQKGEIRHLSVTALQLHYRKARPVTFLKNDSIAGICLRNLQYFEKQLLPGTLMNDCLSMLLTTGNRNRYSICVNTLLGLQA